MNGTMGPRRSVPELEAENARLRKALAEARLERDSVKKAAAYFRQRRHSRLGNLAPAVFTQKFTTLAAAA
jgi:transposase-like protein